MALVLSAIKDRRGDIKRFNVVRAESGLLHEVLEDIDPGIFHILGDDNMVTKHEVSYRIVQDITPVA